MTHFEEIQVWEWVGDRNESGGYIPLDPVRMTLAPTWATINQQSGNDLELNSRKVTENVFEVIVNARPGFSWSRTMFITSRFGNLDVIAISESLRKREITLSAALIEGTGGGGSGGGGADGRIMTIYTRATPGEDDVVISELVGADVLLAFRDGINKEVITVDHTLVNQMKFNVDTGTFELYPGDIFGDELITVLYRLP